MRGGRVGNTTRAIAEIVEGLREGETLIATVLGASAAVVEETVAQAIETAVNGVQDMVSMRSVSANDGSYQLTVSVRLGTDPDMNAVHVNTSVHAALARLPPEVQRNGVTVAKVCSAVPPFIASTRQTGRSTRLPSRTSSPSTRATVSTACPASARPLCSGPRTMRCASGSRPSA